MNRHRTPVLGTIAVIAAVGALVATALLMLPAQATQPTPAPEVSTTILARSLFDPIHVTARTSAPDRWKALLKTHGQSDVYVVDNEFPPGASTGWHSHPGPSLILVVAGTVTNYPGDDPSCTPHTYSKGDGFIDPGGAHLHMLRNQTAADAETIAVQLLPKDAPRRIPPTPPVAVPPSVRERRGGWPAATPHVPLLDARWRAGQGLIEPVGTIGGGRSAHERL